ncbi:hypothetical protein RNJ44_01979 [Nakaseomyces bracarensis]|uniref:Uncharacterized protein n=1 Tax=Nakaseomyces bracarensis TaxID=273131 RepID=A0ABR4NM52_9SACH
MQGRTGVRKRNRLNIAGNNTRKQTQSTTPRVDVGIEEDIDDEDKPDTVLKSISPAPNKRVLNIISAESDQEGDAENYNSEYNEVFKTPKPKILNLEDIDDNNEDTPDYQKITIENNDIKERDYLKTLNDSDKLELTEIMKRTGGKISDSKEWRDFENSGNLDNQFTDSRLAISAAEKRLEQRNRQKEIESALNEQKSDVDDWEQKVIEQQIGKESKIVTDRPVLTDMKSVTAISDYLSNLTKSKTVLSIQLSRLNNERNKLELEIDELTKSLC